MSVSIKLQLQGRKKWRVEDGRRKERRRREGGEKEGKDNVTGDEVFKRYLIWRLQTAGEKL